MAFTPLRVSHKLVNQFRSALTPRIGNFEIRHAGISGKAMRIEEIERPKPWPYKERGYSNLQACFDSTTKRLWENSRVILIEGLPCLGKTEVARTLAEELDMKHFPMITTDAYYINDYGYDMRKLDAQLPHHLQSFSLDDFLKCPSDDRAPNMQFVMYFLKLLQYMDGLAHLLNTGEGVILERSVYSDLVFLETMCTLNYATRWERKAYYKWRSMSLDELMKPHLVIYLDASPATVEENIKRRGKGEEKYINKAFLEILDKNYKQQFLPTISEHAEVLVYDWNTPGEAEIIVEDIENIDFNRFDVLDPKMGDWRLKDEWDWNEKRYNFTHWPVRSRLMGSLFNQYPEKAPRLMWTAEETKLMTETWESAPGMGYNYGYNTDQGDSVLFKSRDHPRFLSDKHV